MLPLETRMFIPGKSSGFGNCVNEATADTVDHVVQM